MLKILVCAAVKEETQAIHGGVCGILRKMKVKAEVSFASVVDDVRKFNLRPEAYDIYVLDAQSRGCLRLAEYIRGENLLSSVIFFNVKHGGGLNDIIRFRPTYLAFGDCSLDDGVKRCLDEQNGLHPYFTVKTKESVMRFEYRDILFFESAQRIVCMYTSSKAVEFYAKLGDIEAAVPRSGFVRCHQSYIVNLAHVRTLDKASRYFILNSGKEIPISKSCYSAAAESYERFISSLRVFC